MPSALDRLEASTWPTLAPPPRQTVSEWADANRMLSPEASAEPGRWRTSRVPYLRAVMDTLQDPTISTVCFWKGSQLGGTECLLNILGYALACDPGPALVIEPTLEMAASFSRDRLDTMIRDTRILSARVGRPRTRDASNTILRKGAAGAVITIAGANSPASLASRPIRLVLADEVDKWDATIGEEGDPLTLAIRRTTSFRRRKIFVVSTPTVAGASRIESWWDLSDRREYFTPCPRCHEPFVIRWEHLRWTDRDPSTAHLVCPSCSGRIDDTERPAMIAAGEWQATAPSTGIAGFRAWEVLAPWRSLRDIVLSFLTAKGSVEALRVWRNTCVAELWEPAGEQTEPAALLARREEFEAECPAGVCAITAGVDTQDDRLEALVVGWGPGLECWILDRQTFMGDPDSPDPWRDLDALLLRRWQRPDGVSLPVHATAIDSGGHRTQAVYGYVMHRQGIPRRVRAVKGASRTLGFLLSAGRTVRPASGAGTVTLHEVDAAQGKSVVYSRLRITEPGPEFVHLPVAPWCDEEFAAQLGAERLETRRNKWGVPVKLWVQTRERNEALDCLVYATAALHLIPGMPAALAAWARRLAPVSTDQPAGGAPTGPTPPPAGPSGPRTSPRPARPRRSWRSSYLAH